MLPAVHVLANIRSVHIIYFLKFLTFFISMRDFLLRLHTSQQS